MTNLNNMRNLAASLMGLSLDPELPDGWSPPLAGDQVSLLADFSSLFPTNASGELLDTWGVALRFAKSPSHFYIVSAGPDGRFSEVGEATSMDDQVVAVVWP
jgi:hypothetical protein